MKKFKIYGFSNENILLITDSENLSPAATFEETMNLEWHMKSSMSFKISDFINGEKNPYIDLIYPGAKIRLILYKNDGYDTYDYIIKTVSSEFAQENIIYSISAEDFASTIYSKEAQGLTLDYTGTMKEIIYEILFQSRKNLNYRNLNKNYLDFNSYSGTSNDSRIFKGTLGVGGDITTLPTTFEIGWTYRVITAGTYSGIVCKVDDLLTAVVKRTGSGNLNTDWTLGTLTIASFGINKTVTLNEVVYITFYRNKDLGSKPCKFEVNILETVAATLYIDELDDGGKIIKTYSVSTPSPNLYTITLTPTKYTSYFKFRFVFTISGNFNATSFKIRLDDTNAFYPLSTEYLQLDLDSFIENQFKGELGDTSYYKKATIQVSNSNLYNALVEAAKLFNGIIYFDYINNMINVVNRETFYSYKGYRLSPTFNLLSLSRDEDYSEFNSVLHISGNEDVYSIYPAVPSEFKVYFQNCIDNNFTGETYFENYKGYPLMKNLVTNGNFSNGTTGWLASGAPTPVAITDGIKITGNGSQNYFEAYTHPAAIAVNNNDKVYIYGKLKSIEAASSIVIRAYNSTESSADFASPTANTVYTLSGVVSYPTAGTYTLAARAIYDDPASANGKQLEVYRMMAINLTATFGAGKEPTAAQMDTILATYPNSWFDGYSVSSYSAAAQYIKNNNYIASTDNYEERAKLIDNFAKAADKVPNFENILYSLDYFYKTGKISETNYNNFKNKINNDLRKLNIKLRVYGERYQTAISILSEKDSLIDENLRRDVADLQALRQIEIDLISTTVEDPTWQGLQNQRQDIEQDIFDRKSKTLDLFNFTYSADIGTLSHIIEDIELNTAAIPYKIKANSYTSLMLNAYGYYNIYKNGIKQKIDELNILISRYENEVISNSARIVVLAGLIEDIGNEEDPISIEYSVEKAGLESRNENLVYYIGDSVGGTYPINGIYKTKRSYLQNILNILGNHLYRETLIDYSEWIVGSPTVANWTYTGTVDTVLEDNKDGISDLMMKITGTGAVRATSINLTTDSYLAQGLFKIPSGTSGTITIKLVYVPPSGDIPELSFTFTSVTYDRWLGFNFKPNSTGSNAYWFPSEAPISGITSKYNSISIPGSGYELNYAFSGTGPVYLYRPRIELLSSARYTINDVYFLYDNPLMINYEEDLKLQFNLIEGLYDLLYNENYPSNISVEKQELLNELFATYEPFLIEGYYENTDEVDSEGLLEQALISFGLYSYPRINYGVSVIDMSAIEGYEFINIEVGDKIKIAEETDRLYKSYQPEDTKYLQVSQIAYDLRQPQSTTLTVAQDDENRKLLQYIIKAVS